MDDRAGPSLAAAQNRRGLVHLRRRAPGRPRPARPRPHAGRLPRRRPGRDRRPPRDPRGRRLLRLRRGPPLRRRRRRRAGGRGVTRRVRACAASRAHCASGRLDLAGSRRRERDALTAAAPPTTTSRRRTSRRPSSPRSGPRPARRCCPSPSRARSRSSRSPAWGALHWMSMLEPAEPGRGWTVAVRRAARGRRDARRRAARGPPAHDRRGRGDRPADRADAAGRAGSPTSCVLPGGWSELAGGISRGISDLPGVRVPYRGLDDWVRTVIPLGGSALVAARRAAGVLAAARPSSASRCAALLLLIVLYVVPVVALDFTRRVPARRGVHAADGRVPAPGEAAPARTRRRRSRWPSSRRSSRSVAAPLLNRDTPWFDYETWAAETSTSKSTSFTWDVQNYGGLNWPRDGRELIRVQGPARPPTGRPRTSTTSTARSGGARRCRSASPSCRTTTRWRSSAGRRRSRSRSATCARTSSSPRATRSDIDIPRLSTIPTSDGLYVPSRTLRRGDAYTATVYTPKPTEAQRRRAGVDYEPSLAQLHDDRHRTCRAPRAACG